MILPAPYNIPEFKIDFQNISLPDGKEIDKNVYAFRVLRQESRPILEISHFGRTEQLKIILKTVFEYKNIPEKEAEPISFGTSRICFDNLISLDRFVSYFFDNSGSVNSGGRNVLKISNLSEEIEIIFTVDGNDFYAGVPAVYTGHDDSPKCPEHLIWLENEIKELGLKFSTEKENGAERTFRLTLSVFNSLYISLKAQHIQTAGEAPKA